MAGEEPPLDSEIAENIAADVLRLVPSDLAADVLEATRSLGGEAQRRDIIDRALDIGGWAASQRAVRSWYAGAARTYHLRTLADYAVDVLRRRGELEPGPIGGRWRLAGGVVPKPLGQVFTAAVGVAGDPVDDDWRADAYAAEFGHIWFNKPSNQLSVGDHLFAIGVDRGGAVIGLFEVLSTGDLRQPRNPWEPDRWAYAVAVRALAGVPPPQATGVDGVRTPRATAYRINDDAQRHDLYAALEGHEYRAVRTSTPPSADEGLASRARALRRLREFDPTTTPANPRRDGATLGRDEAVDLQEKAQRGHHELLVGLHGALRVRGWTDLGEIPAAIDLRGCSPGGRAVIFEAKTITAENETRQCRGGLAQLLEYRQDYGSPDDALCLVVNAPITERRRDLLERLGVAAVLLDQADGIVPLNPSAAGLVAD